MTTAITLTTDFGTADGYVGAMKGVIASIEPRARIADLTHEIPAQDVRAASYALYHAAPYWPEGTVHCAVVDPGVGSARRAVAARAENGQFFVGPDIGLFTLFCPPFTDSEPEAVELTETRWWRDPAGTSSTFHGRDVFAPVAAHLARMLLDGEPDLSAFGPRVRELACFDFPQPVEERGGAYRGEVLHVDHFGNAVTNLPERWVTDAGGHAVVEAGGKTMPVVRTYSNVAIGELCAVVGSSGWLEVACRDDSAASRLGLAPGLPVVLKAPGRGA